MNMSVEKERLREEATERRSPPTLKLRRMNRSEMMREQSGS
jgi:hypothetical protein